MSAVPLPQSTQYRQGHLEKRGGTGTPDWMHLSVGGTLLAGSLLLLTGKRKAGLVVTAAGAALAILEHKEIVTEWWEALPGYLEKAEQMVSQAQETIEDLSAKRDKLLSLFGR